MFKFLSRVVLFATSIQLLTAQSFEWAASGSNLITGYSCSAVTVDGRLVAGGDYAVPSYSISQDEKGVFDGAGSLVKLSNPYSDQFFVTCFSPAGGIAWNVFGSQLAYDTRLKNICARPDGNVIIAFYASYYPGRINSFYDETGEIPGFKNDEPMPEKFLEILGGRNHSNKIELTYFAEFDKSGNLKSMHAFRFKEQDVWYSFECAPDGTMYFTTTDTYKTEENGRIVDKGGNFIVRINSDYSSVKRRLFQYLGKTCCSYMEPGMVCTVSEKGELFAAGSFHTGLRSQGIKDFMVKEIKGNVNNYHFNSYLVKLDEDDLSIQWMNYSESFTSVKSITAADHQVYIGGRFQYEPKVFGVNFDSTGSKKAFLMSFDYSGKPLWHKSFNAEDINALSHDFSGNVYASFHSKRGKGSDPLKIDRDTISDTYERIVLAGFDAKGNYKWSKKSNAMMSNEPHCRLHCDPCGNIYFTGEMWFVLPVSLSLFDAAFVSGKGYGGAPVAARIRTTIQEELMAINTVFSKQFSIDEKEPKKSKTARSKSKTRNSTASHTVSDSLSANADSLDQGGRSKNESISCVPIPFPWTLQVYPNPSDGEVHLKYKTSYNDTSVSLEIRDSKGSLIRILQTAQMKEAGEFTVDANFSDLAAGVYIAVLKGSFNGVTSRFVIAR
jgi:hypothetical protein